MANRYRFIGNIAVADKNIAWVQAAHHYGGLLVRLEPGIRLKGPGGRFVIKPGGWQVFQRIPEEPKTCRHCGVKKRLRPRGLCYTCYYTPEVSALYHTTSKFARRGVAHESPRQRTPEAVAAEPGSEEKLKELERRAAMGLPLHAPEDAKIVWRTSLGRARQQPRRFAVSAVACELEPNSWDDD